MNLFLSTYENHVDKKSRISIPSSYRNILIEQDYNGVIAYPSIKHLAIEFCGYKKLLEISNIIQSLDPYSEARDAFEAIILGEAVHLPFDGEGRVILPTKLKEYAQISDHVFIVGKGLVFEMWNEVAFKEYSTKAKKIAYENRLLLKNLW